MQQFFVKMKRHTFLIVSVLLIVVLFFVGASWDSLLGRCFSFCFGWLVVWVLALRYLRDKVSITIVTIAALCNCSSVICQYSAVAPAPYGTLYPLFVQPFVWILALIVLSFGSLTLTITAIIFCIRAAMPSNAGGDAGQKRNRFLKNTAIGWIAMVTVIASAHYGMTLRTKAFSELGKRFEPLILAIKSYEKENGSPPKQLVDLVPKYIAAVPTSTGMGAYSRYDYNVLKEDAPWELRVGCSMSPLNWDVFYYWPTEKYPELSDGGWNEPIGNWSYVHE